MKVIIALMIILWQSRLSVSTICTASEIARREPEFLGVGTGYFGLMKILPETEKYLKSCGIKLIPAKTEKACKTFFAVQDALLKEFQNTLQTYLDATSNVDERS